jgi:hypothetical protein
MNFLIKKTTPRDHVVFFKRNKAKKIISNFNCFITQPLFKSICLFKKVVVIFPERFSIYIILFLSCSPFDAMIFLYQ